jgi:Riboflavin synthase beta-chain
MDLSININKPIGFGILTCENLDQALARSDPNKKNKGAEVAKACLDILLDEQ